MGVAGFLSHAPLRLITVDDVRTWSLVDGGGWSVFDKLGNDEGRVDKIRSDQISLFGSDQGMKYS